MQNLQDFYFLQEILQDIKISHLARSLYPAEYLAIQSCKMLLLEDDSMLNNTCNSSRIKKENGQCLIVIPVSLIVFVFEVSFDV